MLRFLLAPLFALTLVTVPGASWADSPGQAVPTHPLLKGGVSTTVTPFAEDGSQQNVLPGTSLPLTLTANINSEITNVGDEVPAQVSLDVKDGSHIMLPGQWLVHGVVTEVSNRKRLGRDGYVTIKFDKLCSPDGKYQIPFEATASTKDSVSKTVAKTVTTDSIYVAKGAIGGTLLSVQLTGIAGAVATHGYSLAIGAAAGATLGLVAAMIRKGSIASVAPGEELQFHITKPAILPNFNADALPSAEPVKTIKNFALVVKKAQFLSDPFGDKRSRLLRVAFQMDNQTDKEYGFGNMVVISNHNHVYYPAVAGSDLKAFARRVAAKSKEDSTITFGVDSPKHKYWLVLLDRGNQHELTRVPIN